MSLNTRPLPQGMTKHGYVVANMGRKFRLSAEGIVVRIGRHRMPATEQEVFNRDNVMGPKVGVGKHEQVCLCDKYFYRFGRHTFNAIGNCSEYKSVNLTKPF